MTRKFLLLIMLTCKLFIAVAAPTTISPHIKIDQFGYLPAGKKVAVIVDPQAGYNAAESFNPGVGANQYQVRDWTTDAVIFTGSLNAWNSGATHTQSGDKGWWFDFSSITAMGSYYVFDVANNVGSYRFEINNTVYSEVLKQAMRMFFYQRVNFAKQPPYVPSKWSDAAAFGGANQDYAARSRYAKNDPTTAKDLHGGWYDAGDCNKYTSFTFIPVCNLLETYRQYPAYFLDNYNIPESGNGIPDVLDELKYELDWLTRMQDATGTNGLLLKLGADNYNGTSPPSADNNPRYYVPECTSATLTGAVNFALAAVIYKSLGIPTMTTYGNDLQTRAINAWNRALVTTNNFTSYATTCDDQNIVSGDADMDMATQRELVITAAVYLYEATGGANYKATFDTLYTQSRPIAFYWWGPYYQPVQRALLRYTQLPNATVSVANNIRTIKSNQNAVMSINDYNNKTDLYRAYMPDDQYTWGSNETKAAAAMDNFDFANYGVNPANAVLYREVGSEYLHWFHGVNPMGKVMLSNMYEFGGDNCINEFYHSWFGNGTIWDNVLTSTYGPPPGYVPGGPNKNFTIASITPPAQQPPQKSFKEWNTGWNGTANENSWEITEPTIYTQSAYISLLVRTMAANAATAVPLSVNGITINAKKVKNGNELSWKVSEGLSGGDFDIQRSADGHDFATIGDTPFIKYRNNYSFIDCSPESMMTAFYRIRHRSIAGEQLYSPVVKLVEQRNQSDVNVYPNPANDILTISSYTDRKSRITVQITNAFGSIMYNEEWLQSGGYYSRSITIENLPPGNYFLKLVDGTTIKQKAFLKL